MDVCCECCVFSGRRVCVGLITRPQESYRLWCVQWVWSRSTVKWKTLHAIMHKKKLQQVNRLSCKSAVRIGFNKERRHYTSTSQHPSELLSATSVLVPVRNASCGKLYCYWTVHISPSLIWTLVFSVRFVAAAVLTVITLYGGKGVSWLVCRVESKAYLREYDVE